MKSVLPLAIVALAAHGMIIPQHIMEIESTIDATTGELPLVNTLELQSLITEEALRGHAEILYDIAGLSNKSYGHPTRVIGSKGHWGTLGYIKKQLKKLNGYYDISIQPFKAFMGEVYSYNGTIDGEVPESLTEMDMSPSTPNKKPVTGLLFPVKNSGCNDEDYEGSLGKIVLVKRGECAFGDKAKLAAKYGAKAAFIYNNEEGSVKGTLGVPVEGIPMAPTLGLSLKDGEKYLELLKTEDLEAVVMIDSFVGPITTLNLIAESKLGDPNNVVMLGAHSDSVTAGPGLNDDGSGTISLIEVAKQLSNYNVTNKVRFAWWAAEEEGLLGSNFYASSLTPEENQKIRLFMDYDMMASPNYEYEVYDGNNEVNPNGSQELKDFYIDYYTSNGLNYTLIPFDGRSDYVGFIENGIPGGGIAAGAEKMNEANGEVLDKCYHQLCDDLTNIAWDAFLVNTKLIAHSVATYGESLEGFPLREATAANGVSMNSIDMKYRGDNLIM